MLKKFLHTTLLIFTFSTVFAQFNVTFELNTATIQNIDPSGIYVAGGNGFGVPGDNQMTDPDGDGIYTITLQREEGFSSHYTFLNGNCPGWDCKENLAGLPCSDPANFNDRFLPPLMSDMTIQACFGTCDDDGSCTIITDSIDITIMLNTELIPAIDPGGLYVAGGSGFGSPGDNPLVDPDGDGIYVGTVRRPVGFTSHYTFLNGNCSDYSCKEDIAGLPCSDPTSFNDRFLPPTMEDVTIQACFGNCADDGSCMMNTDSIDITFQLNMNETVVDPSGVFIAGGGAFGFPGDNPMVDPDGDGIYTFTTRRPVGFSSFYTFTNGNCPDFTCKENLDGLPCGDPANFNDRFLPSTMDDTTIQACFGNCADDGSCTTSVRGLTIDENLFRLRPTLVNNFINIDFGENARYQNKQMIIVNSVGQVMHTATKLDMDIYQVDTALYPSGVYAVQVRLGNTMLTKRFVVQ